MLYVGLDIHDKSIAICVLGQTGQIVRRPLHLRLASLCSGQELFIVSYSIITIGSRVATGARSSAQARREEAVQVEIGSGTQVASRGPTWRNATPRY